MPLKNNVLTFNNKSFPVGETTVPVSTSLAPWTTVEIDVDRTVNGGLNSLTSATVVALTMQYSSDGGNTWVTAGYTTEDGGIYTDSQGQENTDTLGFSVQGQTYPTGTVWQFLVDVSGPSAVKASGTVTWE